MKEDFARLRDERIGRYQAAIALEPTDRVPLAQATNYFYEKKSGYTYQQIMYDEEAWTQTELQAALEYPEVDTFRTNLRWSPEHDAVNDQLFKVPGRDLPPHILQQFVEAEWMKEDEYRLFIDDPITYRMDYYLPRILGEMQSGNTRSHVAFFKAGFALANFSAMNRRRMERLAREAGYVPPTVGIFKAPFDYLSDNFRGLHGIMKDMFRRPELVREACDAITPFLVSKAAASADPRRQLPLFVATHKPCFLSPKQFDDFYWPSFKKGVLALIEAGWTFRVFLEGDWTPHWHHIAELPRGKVLCDVDNESDVFEAKKAFGHQQCFSGGIPTEMFILGTPEDIRARVRHLCETVGADGGWIPNGGGHIPEDTKPENYRAMIDAVMEYGRYSSEIKHCAREVSPPEDKPVSPLPCVTPWEKIKEDNDWPVPGDEELIRTHWERLERVAYSWLMRG